MPLRRVHESSYWTHHKTPSLGSSIPQNCIQQTPEDLAVIEQEIYLNTKQPGLHLSLQLNVESLDGQISPANPNYISLAKENLSRTILSF